MVPFGRLFLLKEWYLALQLDSKNAHCWVADGYIFHTDQQTLLSHLHTQLSKMLTIYNAGICDTVTQCGYDDLPDKPITWSGSGQHQDTLCQG